MNVFISGTAFDSLSDNSSPNLASSTEGPVESSSENGSSMSANTTPCPEEQIYNKPPSTEGMLHQHLEEDDSILPVESNPAYPSLPDIDFSIRDNNFEADILDEPRSIGGAASTAVNNIAAGSGMGSSIEDNKAGEFEESSAHYGSGNGMLPDELMFESDNFSGSSSPSSLAPAEGSGDALATESYSTENYGKHKATSQIIQLMQYSGEDLSAETKIANITDFQTSNETKTETSKEAKPLHDLENNSDDSLELGSGLIADLGSGSGELKMEKPRKEREPTTPKPRRSTTPGDIDGLGEGSGSGSIEPEEDPKEDVESLKLDENQNDASSNVDKSPKHNILAVQIKPQQEKTLEHRTLLEQLEQE